MRLALINRPAVGTFHQPSTLKALACTRDVIDAYPSGTSAMAAPLKVLIDVIYTDQIDSVTASHGLSAVEQFHFLSDHLHSFIR